MVPKNNPVQQDWKMFITKPSTLTLVIFLDLAVFSAYLDIKGGLKRVKYSFQRKSDEKQSCLFYWNLQIMYHMLRLNSGSNQRILRGSDWSLLCFTETAHRRGPPQQAEPEHDRLISWLQAFSIVYDRSCARSYLPTKADIKEQSVIPACVKFLVLFDFSINYSLLCICMRFVVTLHLGRVLSFAALFGLF